MKLKIKQLRTCFSIVIFLPAIMLAQEKPEGPHIPLEKNLNPQWVESLFEKGERKVYQGDQLKHIAMPCGGIGAGQVVVTGEGKICFTESVYNQMQEPNAGHGLSTGYQYLHPQELVSKVGNSFSLIIEEDGLGSKIYNLSKESFDDIRFIGEYPLAQIEYRSTERTLPLEIGSEVFSPFVPLDLRSSANPLTVLKFTISNTSDKAIETTLAGHMENIEFPADSLFKQHNTNPKAKGIKGISLEMQAQEGSEDLNKHPQLGGFSLSVLDQDAEASFDEAGGSLSSTITLRPGESREITFLISWYFPNGYENGRRYKDAMAEAPGWVGHIYNNWYNSSFDVAKYVATNVDKLYNETKLFRDTYNDNTLPYWLANRITMPVSTLASGNVSIWQNGRMYAYEGVGFCQGTCGHVYNFVTAVSRLFPQLERSVRLLQDFNDSGAYAGYSQSGRINFRGYGVDKPSAVHSYASDAQSGYVLKAYREHLMSPDMVFLESIWDKVKMAMGYHIFKDGAEIGLEPNGVLEGKQTFWDPMWYGPNPYNNTLYLAALRAAEEMALVMGESELAKRYHRIFESGQNYMDEKMWNGEFYVHLYPIGFMGDVGVRNGFSSPEQIDDNAQRYIENFNQGGENYYVGGGCDANQLFGQNWANQLGLGYILPAEKCERAAKSIFQYCWTPDIATVYDFGTPKYRTLAAAGEGAMVNAGWPHKAPVEFENIHDKSDIWSGLEYEASCDMINEGLLEEAFIAIRSIHDRYDGIKRNPWNEIEGSDHYSRAMHSWNIILSLSGFTYDGPAGIMGFNPRLTPDDFKCFFTSAEAWGNISQIRSKGLQEEIIEVKWGQMQLRQLKFVVNPDMDAPKVKAFKNGKGISSRYQLASGEILITFDADQILEKGDQILIILK